MHWWADVEGKADVKYHSLKLYHREVVATFEEVEMASGPQTLQRSEIGGASSIRRRKYVESMPV